MNLKSIHQQVTVSTRTLIPRLKPTVCCFAKSFSERSVTRARVFPQRTGRIGEATSLYPGRCLHANEHLPRYRRRGFVLSKDVIIFTGEKKTTNQPTNRTNKQTNKQTKKRWLGEVKLFVRTKRRS